MLPNPDIMRIRSLQSFGF